MEPIRPEEAAVHTVLLFVAVFSVWIAMNAVLGAAILAPGFSWFAQWL